MESLQIRKNIKHLRKAKGLTQKKMAESLFMDERTYSNFERGVKKSIDVKLLLSISKILEVDLITLISNPGMEKENTHIEQQFQQILYEICELKMKFVLELKELKKEFRIEKQPGFSGIMESKG